MYGPYPLGVDVDHGLSIGELARLAGVNVETIRFYERSKLLSRPARPRTGYRRYPRDAARRVQFIRRAKSLGFTLGEVRELLSMKATRGASCESVRERALRKMADVELKLAELTRMRDALGELASACTGNASMAECSILDALSSDTGS